MRSRYRRTYIDVPPDWRCLKVRGAKPFVSQIVFRCPDGTIKIWESRWHRKKQKFKDRNSLSNGFQQDNLWLGLWKPQQISWWIIITSIIGSVLYVLGASVSLFYELIFARQLTSDLANWCYLGGSSIIFISFYLELLETINANQNKGVRAMSRQTFKWWAWKPEYIGFWSIFLPMIGIFLFNLETAILLLQIQLNKYESISRSLGCIFFVFGNYMGFVEVCHQAWDFKFNSLQWWIKFLQLFGALCFLVGAVVGTNLPIFFVTKNTLVTNVSYFIGTVLFLAGSFLMLLEQSSD